jgi:hypothetical protein
VITIIKPDIYKRSIEGDKRPPSFETVGKVGKPCRAQSATTGSVARLGSGHCLQPMVLPEMSFRSASEWFREKIGKAAFVGRN